MSKDWTEQTAIQLLEEDNARLRMALNLIIDHPVASHGQWWVGVKEIKRVAASALSGEYQMPLMEDDDVKA